MDLRPRDRSKEISGDMIYKARNSIERVYDRVTGMNQVSFETKPNLFNKKLLRDSQSNVTLRKNVDLGDRSSYVKSSMNKRGSDSILS